MGNSKYIFILLLSTQWLGNPLFSQEQEFKRIFYNYTAAPEESNETRILEITMWESHRFTYKSWLDYLDCFSWRDYSGTWSEVNDTIYFYDQIIRNGFDISTEFRKGKDTSNLEIQFTTSDDAEVQGAHVEFRFSYPGYT